MTAPGIVRDHYLEHLRIRTKGIERVVLAPRRKILAVFGLGIVAAATLLGIGAYEEETACVGGSWPCNYTQEAVAGALIAGGALLAALLVLVFLPLMMSRWTHRHRRAAWEIDYGPSLGRIEQRIVARPDAPADTQRARDLLEQTLAGDFVGERVAVRGDFWAGLGLTTMLVGGIVVVFSAAMVGGEDGVMFALVSVPLWLGGLAFRLMGKKARALGRTGIEKHVAEVKAALENKTDLPSPTFSSYIHGGPAASAQPGR